MNRKCVDEKDLFGYVVIETHPCGFKDRLENFRKHIGLSQSDFADSVGISKESYKQIKDNPSLQMILKFMRKYPELSLDYLAMGVGSMLRTDTPTNVNNFDLSSVSDNAIKVTGDNNNVNTKDEALQKVLEMQQQLINYLTTDKA